MFCFFRVISGVPSIGVEGSQSLEGFEETSLSAERVYGFVGCRA